MADIDDDLTLKDATNQDFVAATDYIGAKHYPYAKLAWGAPDTANIVDTASGKPIPMQLRTATGLVPIGEPTDAKSTATDTTSASAIAIWKQVSASVQASASSLGTLAGSVVTLGPAAGATSQPVVLANDQKFFANAYETVPAGVATPQVLGPGAGATGDYIAGILVIPTSTSPGAVTLLDNAIAIVVFAGGASSVSNLVPFYIPLGMVSQSGAWKLTTGANVTCVATGKFS